MSALASLAHAQSAACNPEYQEIENNPSYQDEDGPTGKLTFLPQNEGGLSPAALDGSPYAFYPVFSTTGSSKWTIQIQGGGWCYDEVDCYCRSFGNIGTPLKLY